MRNYFFLCVCVFVFLLGADIRLSSAEKIEKWLNQTVYVPIYSHIYAEERYRDKPFNLTVTLSIRNTDPQNGLRLTGVDYYDSSGKKLRSFLTGPVAIQPLGSTRYIIQESDNSGGSGAKFLVHWEAQKAVTEPIIESIMIGTKLQQGISFVSRGRVIEGQTEE
ncbi:MAG: DUF3124 domain-containing protein [Desulfobulbaceae bacterium]|nr:DUF3124 domain-containing protein [Desulfobulbaceae bacterium]